MNKTPDPFLWFKNTRPARKRFLSRFYKMLPIFAASLLGGCSELVLFHPKGPIGDTERFVISVAFFLMLLVVIPVIFMALWIPWKYRASNTKSTYAPTWNFSGRIELVVWLIPIIIVMCLGVLIWGTTRQLDPFAPLESNARPVNIEAVSLDWKWLFIYPDENIAVVNQLVFPAGVPLNFRITSDTVMTSFFIPQLGSQIYAMAGMQTKLHLLADEPGTYDGQNQQFSGEGYAYMNFKAIATSPGEYATWLKKLRNSPETLNSARYQELQKPTPGYPVTYFSSVTPELFKNIIRKYHKKNDASAAATNGKSRSISLTTAAGLEGD